MTIRRRRVTRARRLSTVAVLLGLGLVGASCGAPGPKPIAYGQQNCDYCRMAIGDRRFGSELVTDKGKTYAFDSIECLASFYLQAQAQGTPARAAWVSDFAHPGTLVRVDSARFLRGGQTHSPMGLGLMAFASDADAASVKGRLGGEPMRWDEVLTLVERGRDRRADAPADGEARAAR